MNETNFERKPRQMPVASSSRSRTLYEVLGIHKGASADDIKKAYKKKALETHPDKLEPKASIAEQQYAVKQFHRVHEAFEVLNDPEKRKEYDASVLGGGDPSLISSEARRRIEERKTWAMQQRLELERRLKEIKSKMELQREEEAERLEKQDKEAQLVQDMLNEMYKMNPEFAKRREAALQRKAERERADKLKRSSSRTFQS
ncbi:DnaJ domain-containing protein [Crepidotus variabilis]|uniref:DnaJ domain-containing protein n=1 Tax=Crepidotus variabilis TaxID=179855 RepID=A0A9P6EL08_9AGAR|nr:DnaJ domain-containing protein [Crepidotus variabilis]